jgi:hypothetical protein
VALDVDMAAEMCLSINGQPPVATLLLALAKGLSGDSGQVSSTSPQFVGGPASNEGAPVYVDGEFRGYGESIPMSEEEFINRTVAPPAPPAGQRWWQTTGTPHVVGGRGSSGQIIDFNDPDVV